MTPFNHRWNNSSKLTNYSLGKMHVVYDVYFNARYGGYTDTLWQVQPTSMVLETINNQFNQRNNLVFFYIPVQLGWKRLERLNEKETMY